MTILILASRSAFLLFLVTGSSLHHICQPGDKGCFQEESEGLISVESIKPKKPYEVVRPEASPVSAGGASLLELVGGRAGRAEKMLESFKGGLTYTPEIKTQFGLMIKMIEDDIESAIIQDFTETQGAYNHRVDQLENFTQKAWNTYQRAIVKDTNYVTCVGQEKELADNHSACTDSSGIKASTRATDCESSNSSKSMSYELTMPDFTCDFANDDDCTSTWNLFASQARGKLSAIRSTASIDNAVFAGHFAECLASAQAEKDQQAKCSDTELAWRLKMAECAGKNTERSTSICAFAYDWQKKCMLEWDDFLGWLDVYRSGNNQTSEDDRQEEWNSLSIVKCMLQTYIDTDEWSSQTLTNCKSQQSTYETSVGVFDWRHPTVARIFAYSFDGECYGQSTGIWNNLTSHDFSTQSWTIQPESTESRTIDGTVYTLNNDVEYNIDNRIANDPLDICE